LISGGFQAPKGAEPPPWKEKKNLSSPPEQIPEYAPGATTRENRIYIRGEFTRKKCKTAILLYCFHTAGVLHIFVLYNLVGPGVSCYRKVFLKII